MIAANQSRISIVDIKRLAEDIEGRLSILSSTSDTHSPDGSDDIDVCTLDTIDDTLTHSLSQVRTLRNEKAPINTLPPEILVIILEILAGPRSLSSTSPLSPPGSINPLGWMAVTHVCRYWRRTALGYPFLWSPIVFSPPDIENIASLPYEWLRRSSGAPLDVQISCGGATSTRVWTKLAERSQRLRKLHILDLTDTEILLQFNGEAPLLESLCLRVSDRITDIPRSDEDDGGALLSDELPLLFAGSTPSLRYLTITFFTRFGGNQFANLTYLHVADQIYDTPSDLSRLLVLLETSPG
ncbi:hypothetical protein NM688_g3671 [Phlebia brevispora]|uniref:Uncharacterized protein n=1 Tax=Phlebia brevispora TaxID=194682 RepID=A0ACC1T5B7_9APHY|nr:hypothetical protein NM688_g3671 [Phlebia brevispora]